jgi:hypothetical protein
MAQGTKKTPATIALHRRSHTEIKLAQQLKKRSSKKYGRRLAARFQSNCMLLGFGALLNCMRALNRCDPTLAKETWDKYGHLGVEKFEYLDCTTPAEVAALFAKAAQAEAEAAQARKLAAEEKKVKDAAAAEKLKQELELEERLKPVPATA